MRIALAALLAVAQSATEAPADDVPLAGYDAGGVRVPSSPAAWGGERDATSDRVVRYQIKARLDPVKHTVEGSQRLTWRNRSARPISAVYLHLYLNAFESSGTTFMREMRRGQFRGLGSNELKKGQWGFIDLRKVEQGGKRVPWRFVRPDGGPPADHTVARLDLPEPVAPGGSTTLEIDFFDQLPRVIARTGHHGRYHLVAQWFPKIGVLEVPGERGATAPRWNCHEFHLNSEFYADFGSFDVELTVPRGFTVGATGALQASPRETPQGLAHRYLQDDVHDFAWTAWDGFAPPLDAEWSHEGSPRVKVRVLHPPEYSSSAQLTLKATLDALTYFSDTLGPYPYGTVTAVVPPFGAWESGGMEYPTFFTTIGTNAIFTPGFSQMVTVHEFGHGYFYGLLASNEFEEPFLDEGLNEFWTTRMLDSRGTRWQETPPILGRLGLQLMPGMTRRESQRLGGSARSLADTLSASAWKRHGSIGWVYDGTAVWFHDLEARLGGDALARGFKEYYRRWKFRHPSTADLQQALEEATGQRALVHEFFENHVHRSAALDDRIDQLRSEEALPEIGSQLVAGQRKELTADDRDKAVKEARKAWKKAHGETKKDGPGPFPFRTTLVARRHGAYVPQTILMKFADGSEKRIEWAEREKWKKWIFETPARAVSAELDREKRWMADWNKLDDARAVEKKPLAARRWATEAGAWFGLLFAVLEGL